MVRQRPAKPCTPVRIRSPPPKHPWQTPHRSATGADETSIGFDSRLGRHPWYVRLLQGHWRSWLARLHDTQEVTGSTPVWPTLKALVRELRPLRCPTARRTGEPNGEPSFDLLLRQHLIRPSSRRTPEQVFERPAARCACSRALPRQRLCKVGCSRCWVRCRWWRFVEVLF